MTNLNNEIRDDIEKLYLRLRREETVTILKRLVMVSEDLNNLISLLLSKELESSDYTILKIAYHMISWNKIVKIQ